MRHAQSIERFSVEARRFSVEARRAIDSAETRRAIASREAPFPPSISPADVLPRLAAKSRLPTDPTLFGGLQLNRPWFAAAASCFFRFNFLNSSCILFAAKVCIEATARAFIFA
mmetsp:Transcript_16733/g.50243  ORF Transcript_16733/g.50243 Transcript_16733/m.50243 type:complete len:114 (-) Transcript_16733:855-1196(-)